MSVRTAVHVWYECGFDEDTKMKPKYFLWGQMTMKVYATQTVLSSIAGVTRKTFRKWSFRSIKNLADNVDNVVSKYKPTTTLSYHGIESTHSNYPRFNGIIGSEVTVERLARSL